MQLCFVLHMTAAMLPVMLCLMAPSRFTMSLRVHASSLVHVHALKSALLSGDTPPDSTRQQICGRGYYLVQGLHLDPTALKLEHVALQGTIALVDAAKKQGVSKFVLMSSLLTNGAAKGQGFNPTFLALNVFGGVLSKKLEVSLVTRSWVCNAAQLLPDIPDSLLHVDANDSIMDVHDCARSSVHQPGLVEGLSLGTAQKLRSLSDKCDNPCWSMVTQGAVQAEKYLRQSGLNYTIVR